MKGVVELSFFGLVKRTATVTQFAAIVALGTFGFAACAPKAAYASSSITCARGVITKLEFPTGPYGFQSGHVTFSNGTWALLLGAPNGTDARGEPYTIEAWRVMRIGDHVMTCINRAPRFLCHKPIYVADFDADFTFSASEGPEGTC